MIALLLTLAIGVPAPVAQHAIHGHYPGHEVRVSDCRRAPKFTACRVLPVMEDPEVERLYGWTVHVTRRGRNVEVKETGR